jgi:hypothetical protein
MAGTADRSGRHLRHWRVQLVAEASIAMRGLRSTIALLVVLVGLGAYIYFVTSKKTGDAASKQEKLFASVEPDKIEELKIKSATGEITSIKKEGDAWKVTAPVAAPASASEASAITGALEQLDIVRVVDENPADLKEYGLDSPRLEVDFKSADGKPSGVLLVGEKTATGANLYARRGDQKRVVLIGASQETTLNKSTFDLRDKTVVKFDRGKVDGVDVNLEGKPLEFAKSGSEWKVARPIAARADFSSVEALVGRVETAQMKSIVTTTPTPQDLKKYGLDKPAVTVNLHLGSARASLMIGGKADDGGFYARDGSKPDVVTVDSTLVDDLKKKLDDYRRKDVFEFRAFNATHVEITRDGQTVVFERVKGEGNGAPDKWRRVSPNPGEPDRQKVESLLAGLADIRATSFTDSKAQTGLESPAMTVVAKFDEGKKEERVTFGKHGNDVFVSRPDEPGAAKIESEKFDETVKALDELSK